MSKKDDEKSITEKVKTRKKKEAAEHPVEPAEEGGNGITPKFVDECLYNNEMGDGFLFAAQQKGKFIFIPEMHHWAGWNEHYWAIDTKDHAAARAAIGMEVADVYAKRAREVRDEANTALSKDKKDLAAALNKKADQHRSRAFALKGKRCKSALEWVYAIDKDFVVPNATLDTDPYLWGFQNGVVDIRTGKLRPGQPDDMITKVSPFDWPGLNAKAPLWDELKATSLAAPLDFKGDKADYLEKKEAYYHRYVGHSICGHNRERCFMLLYGPHGSNGKTTLMETILEGLGPLGVSIAPDIFLDTKAIKNPDAPTSTIMSMKGKRIIITSETNPGQRWSPALMKKYSGNDSLSGRSPHDKDLTTFSPTHSNYFLINNLPITPMNDSAFFERLHIILFHWSFVANPKQPYEKRFDPDLMEKLKKELPAICAWIVRGYHAYVKAGGLHPTEESEAFKRKYQFSNDVIEQWLVDCCHSKKDIEATAKERFKELFGNFEAWHRTNIGDRVMAKKTFSKLLEEKGFEKNNGGTRYFYGIQLMSIHDEM